MSNPSYEEMEVLGQTNSEIMLLLAHDEGEELHAFDDGSGRPRAQPGPCVTCGDTTDGLMHNNTWRNVEPLIDLDACTNGCIDPENHKEF